MERILIITTQCFGKALANGICANNIAQAFRCLGKRVWILGMVNTEEEKRNLQENESAVVFDSSKVNYTFFLKLKNVCKGILGLPRRKEIEREYYELAVDLVKTNRIDTVISFFFPIETTIVALQLKRKYPNIKCVHYELDSYENGAHSGKFYDKSTAAAQVRGMRRLYPKLDVVVVMRSHKEYIMKTFRRELEGRLIVSDLPVLVQQERNTVDSEYMDVFYTGILNRAYRNPQRVLEAFSLIKNDTWRLHFFSRGDCEELISEYAKENAQITQHGYVTQGELNTHILRANCFLSIGNQNSESVPSKLISYIASGKPIIHFSLKQDDVCAKYLSRYPFALVIPYDMNIEEASVVISCFLQDSKGKQVPYTYIEREYRENDPMHSAKLIETFLE